MSATSGTSVEMQPPSSGSSASGASSESPDKSVSPSPPVAGHYPALEIGAWNGSSGSALVGDRTRELERRESHDHQIKHEQEKEEHSKKKTLTAKQSSAVGLPTLQDYLNYIEKLYSPNAWSDAPRVSVAYRNLSYHLPVPIDETANPSMWRAFKGLFVPKKKTTLDVFDDLTGVIPSGKMTLLLAPPGAGKSQFLKTIGGHMRNNKYVKGDLLYDGLSPAEQLKAGLYTEKLCALVAQGDVHMANLVCRETLQFAMDNAVVPLSAEAFVVDPEAMKAKHDHKKDFKSSKTPTPLDPALVEYHNKKVDLLLSVLGLHECANTIAGNDMIRGISGGQKKRLTIGELMITNARVLLLDEPTTGLDAAVSRDIMVVLKDWCRVSGGTVVAALLQATPECFELYEDLILMKDGRIVYHGPRLEVSQFMEQHWGFITPDDMDLADFIVNVLTNPAQQMAKQEKAVRQGKMRRKFPTLDGRPAPSIDALVAPSAPVPAREDDSSPAVERSASMARIHTYADEEDDSPKNIAKVNSSVDNPLLKKDPSDHPAVTTEELLQRYRASPYFQFQQSEFDRIKQEGQQKNLKELKYNRSPYTLAQYGQLYTRGFVTHTRLALGRQFTLLGRDKQTAPPRAISAIIQALIFGSLFYRLSDDNFFPKLGILLFSIMFFAMGNFTELPATFEGRNAVYKQVDAGMFPTLSYMIAITLASIPIILIESGLYCVILYFMIGLAEDAGRFFFFWLMMIMGDLMFSTGFRAVCYKVVSIDQAQQVAMPIMNIMMIYSGFLILKPEIKDWQIEFFWLSPFSWIIRSVALNEFNDSKFDDFAPNTQTRRGDYYLQSFGMDTDSAFKWAGFGYTAGTIIFFTYLAARWLRTTRFDLLQGTKRLKIDQHESDTAERRRSESGSVKVQVRASQPAKSIGDLNARSSQAPINSVLPFTPASFVFKNINYTVTVKSTDKKSKGPSTYQKQLLKDVSGYVKPGQLTALMGSSGAGKTTLIDVIAGRKTEGIITGDILVNGQPKSDDETTFRRISGYCEQRDMHVPLATVRESLMFSAAMRLPKTVTEEQRREYVNEVLDILELTPLADRIVGNEKYAGLSPGQLKLLTIGVELAANPSILFLDEPTSGLDSRAAVVVMRVVKKIAMTGRTVLCTIHQPSSDVFFYFDSMLLLRSGGQTVYFGDLGKEGSDLVKYFESTPNEKGEYPKCPEGMNPASWMLDVIGAGLSGALKRATAAKGGHKEGAAKAFDYADVYRESELNRVQSEELDRVVKDSQSQAIKIDPDLFAIPLASQVKAVVGRGFTSYWRDEQMNFGRLLMLVFISLIFGIVYVQLDEDSYTGLTSKTSAVFSIAGFIAMLSAQTTLPNIFGERAVYYREQASRAYPSWVYSTTTALTEIPYVFISTLFGVIIFYFMVGYQNDASLFFQFWLALSLLVLIESSFGQFAAALFPNFVVAIQLAGAINTLFFLFGGLFIRPADIPEGWKWFYYMNPIPKGIIAIVLPQFRCDLDNPFEVTSGCPTIIDPVSNVPVTIHKYVGESWDIGYDNIFGRMIGWLVLTYGVFRVGTFLSLKYINHLKR